MFCAHRAVAAMRTERSSNPTTPILTGHYAPVPPHLRDRELPRIADQRSQHPPPVMSWSPFDITMIAPTTLPAPAAAMATVNPRTTERRSGSERRCWRHRHSA